MTWHQGVEQLVKLLSAYAWPVAVCVIFLAARHRFNRILAKIPGFGEIEALSDTSADLSEKPPADEVQATAEDWKKAGNLYWLGHDIRWAMNAIFHGSREDMCHGLQTALFHLKQLELPQEDLARTLHDLLDSAQRDDIDWTAGQRKPHARALRRIIRRIGATAAARQGDFVSPPQN